ncbi:hypothetical protein [Brevibacterium litoralis]|uniref:hypothetical protein n=1 Tax=Brevibacterium litoralis TaxID=3138935 RepID=UPI0032EC55EF
MDTDTTTEPGSGTRQGAGPDARALVYAEVTAAVRDRGLDPRTDTAAVRDLVVDVVHDYDERTLSGSLPLLPDLEATVHHIVDALTGYGPIQTYLDDPEVEEIWITSPIPAF